MIEIFHGDCEQILPTLQANTFATWLTDPPAGNLTFIHKTCGKFGPFVLGDVRTKVFWQAGSTPAGGRVVTRKRCVAQHSEKEYRNGNE
jgi:hypothetical protein